MVIPPGPPTEPPVVTSELPAVQAPAGGAAAELDMNQIASQVGQLVSGPIGKQLRFELLRELRRELVVDRERKGRFLDG